MCLITRGREASGQEIRPDVGLPLMGPDGKWNEIGVLLFKLKKKNDSGGFSGNPGKDLTRVHSGQYVIKACFKSGSNIVGLVFLLLVSGFGHT